MLNRIYRLTWLFVKTSFSSTNKTSRKKTTRILLYVALYAYVVVMVGIFSKYLYELTETMRQPQMFVGLILAMNVMLTLFTTLIASLNVLYFSDDNAALLPMPIRPMEMVSGRINALLIYEYLEETLLGVIPLGMYAILSGQPWYFWILMFIVLIFLPVIPVVIASLLIMFLMSFSGKMRNKKVVQAVTTVISLVLVMGISMSISMSNSDQTIMDLIKPNGMANIFSRYFPTIGLAADTLNKFAILPLILLILLSVIVYGLMIIFSQKLYYKGMVGSLFSSSGISKKKMNEQTAYKTKGTAVTYILKEIKMYYRKPTFLVQLLLPCVIMPIFMAVVFYISMNQAMGEEGMNLMDELMALYRDPTVSRFVFYIGLLVMFFSAMYSFLASVAISKDGRDAVFMKTIPVPFYKQLIYKAVPDILMTLFIFLLVAVLMIFLFRIPLSLILAMMAVAVPFSVLHGSILLFDLKNPKLEWSNELEVCKNNLRTLIPVGVGLGNLAIVAVLGFWAGLSIPVMTGLLCGVYTVLAILVYLYIRKKDIALADHIM